MNLKSIFQFNDPFKFLEHYYEFHKRNTPGYSYEAFSIKAKIKSPNYLKLIIDKKKKITLDKLVAISIALNFSFEEKLYFEDLVNYHQADSAQERAYFKKKLERYKDIKPLYSYSRSRNNFFIEEWYVPVVLLSLHQTKITDDLTPLMKGIGIEEGAFKNLLERLLKEEFITIEDNAYLMTNKYLLYDSRIPGDVRLKKFLSQSMDFALASFRQNFEKGKFHSQYYKIDGKNLRTYHEKLEKLLHDLTNTSDNESGSDIYLLNFQFIKILGNES